jgi:hypothetical protein
LQRLGGDFLSNADMFFDGGDPLERVVDFPPIAGDVVDFLSKVIELAAKPYSEWRERW